MGLVAGFPLTPAAVARAREREGFRTPLEPIREGEMWCVFEQRGTYEFMCHPFDAIRYLEHGMLVDGERLSCVKVDEYPMIGAWHILAIDESQNQQFTPDVRGDPDQSLPEVLAPGVQMSWWKRLLREMWKVLDER